MNKGIGRKQIGLIGLVGLMGIIGGLVGCDSSANDTVVSVPHDLYCIGADVSFAPEMEAGGYAFQDADGVPMPLPELLDAQGWKGVRFRLWVDPAGGHSGFEEVLAATQRYRAAGFAIGLDLHYSDWWADPGHQTKPARWESLDYAVLLDTVEAYTERVVRVVQPDWVQPGNEINLGLLWPTGHINSQNGFLGIMRAATAGCRKGAPEAEIWIHYAGHQGAADFYSTLEYHRIDYDGVALSYYPWWHGQDLEDLASALDGLNALTNKPTLIVETAYPHTLQWGDWTHNVFGNAADLHPDFPATPEGQKAFLEALDALCRQAPECRGWYYWAPEWTSWKGPQATDGSAWENLALFDFNGRALPGLRWNNP